MGSGANVELVEVDHTDSLHMLEQMAREAWVSTHERLFRPGAIDLMMAGDATITWRVGEPWKTCMAYVAGDPLGFTIINLYREPDELGKQRALVEPLHVRPTIQRQRIGTRLWDWARNEGAAAGFPSLGVWVIRANEPALSFYGSRPGIRRTGRQGQMIIGGVIQIAVEFRLDRLN